MPNRIIDSELTLIPYYPNESVTLPWYQDPALCKQMDNVDHVYTLEHLQAMYAYLCANGDCYYIQYCGALAGDVTLLSSGEIAITICKEFQNRHIGRRCIREMLALAREKGFSQVKAEIYSFNVQSQKAFLNSGFRKAEGEWYVYDL